MAATSAVASLDSPAVSARTDAMPALALCTAAPNPLISIRGGIFPAFVLLAIVVSTRAATILSAAALMDSVLVKSAGLIGTVGAGCVTPPLGAADAENLIPSSGPPQPSWPRYAPAVSWDRTDQNRARTSVRSCRSR